MDNTSFPFSLIAAQLDIATTFVVAMYIFLIIYLLCYKIWPLSGTSTNDVIDTESDVLNCNPINHPIITDFTLDDIKEVCLKSIPQWGHLNKENLKVRRLDGSSINYVFKVSTRIPNELNEVIIRFFGNSLSCLINRDNEIEAFKAASDLGIGARQITLFEFSGRKGRIEEFLPGQNLTFDQYIERDICLLVARELARYSRLMTPKLNHWPHRPELLRYFDEWTKTCANSPIQEQCYDMKLVNGHIEEYLELLDKRVATGRYAFKLAPCHNDPHLFNILYEETTNILRLLDFEMTAFNYHGYNLASYMCESLIDYRTPKRYPYFTIHTYKNFPLHVALDMCKTYLDESGVGYDDNFVRQFLDDVKFIQVGWWLSRVLFNCVIAFASNDDSLVNLHITWSKLFYHTHGIKRQDAIDSGNWYI